MQPYPWHPYHGVVAVDADAVDADADAAVKASVPAASAVMLRKAVSAFLTLVDFRMRYSFHQADAAVIAAPFLQSAHGY
jgi:hypothetical protein